MSKYLKSVFIAHLIVALVFGVFLLLAPGRFLGLFGWAPVDPLLSRLLGAALLGLAWSSFRGWRATDLSQVTIIVEAEAVFCVLGCIGLLRHLMVAYYPMMVWFAFLLLLIFAILWIIAIVLMRQPPGTKEQGTSS